jgi:hypothetical protein
LGSAQVEPIRPSTFKEVAAYLEPDGDVYLYLNSDQAAAKVLEFADVVAEGAGSCVACHQPKERPQVERVLKALRQFALETGALEIKGMGMSSVRKGGMESSRAVLYHGDTQPTGRLWQIGGGKPHAFTGLLMMPKNTVAAYTGDCRLDLLWETIDSLATTIGPDARDGLRELRKSLRELGDLDATMAAFTGQITIILTLDPERTTPLADNPDVEIPELSLLIAASVNAAHLHGAFENAFGAHPQIEHLEIPGATAFTLRAEEEQPMRWWPTFAKTESQFIFASNPDVVSAALNVPVGDGLATSAEFQQMQTGMPTEGNQLFFVSRRLGDELGRIAKQLAPEAEAAPPIQLLSVNVRHADAMVGYSKQSANFANALPDTIAVIGTAWSSQALSGAYARLKEANRPLTLEELLPEPPADNAAPHYENAIAELGDTQLEEQTTALLEGNASAENQSQWAKSVARGPVAEAFAEIRRGADKTYFKDLDWDAGPAMQLPHISEARKLCRIICANAVHLAATDKLEAAWEEMGIALSLSDALANEPLLISQLVRVAEYAICHKAMMQVATFGPPSAEQAAKLDALIAVFESVKPMARAMDGERIASGEWVYKNYRNPQLFGEVAAPVWTAPFTMLKPLVDLDHAGYLDALGGYATNLERPLEQIDRNMKVEPPPYGIISSMVLPAVNSAGVKAVGSATSARIARLALAALRLHADTGKYPATLDELRTPHSREDPFSGRPFTYESDDRGFRIGSVGKKGDISWQLETK